MVRAQHSLVVQSLQGSVSFTDGLEVKKHQLIKTGPAAIDRCWVLSLAERSLLRFDARNIVFKGVVLHSSVHAMVDFTVAGRANGTDVSRMVEAAI